MHELDFKKLLIDLRLSRAAIAREVDISETAVRKYFRGSLRNPERRAQIKQILATHAKRKAVRLPAFWQGQSTD